VSNPSPDPTRQPVVPLPGPLDQDPTIASERAAAGSFVPLGPVTAATMLSLALARIGIGRWDRELAGYMLGDASTTATVASWLRRSYEAGVADGRAERVEETETIPRLQGMVTAVTQRLDSALADSDALRRKVTDLARQMAALQRAAGMPPSSQPEPGEETP
jgi:hypothetical protein